MLRIVSFHLSATTALRRRYHSFCRHFLTTPPKTFESLLQGHALLITTDVATNPFIAAKLISLYSVFHNPRDSTFVFNSTLPTSDAFLWNSIIQSHFSNADYLQTLRLYSHMIHTGGISPTHFTFPMVASACGEVGDFYLGCSAHCGSIKLGILGTPQACTSLVAVGSSFVYMYCKCGFLNDAVKLFEEMPLRDVVTWTAVITGFVSNGVPKMGLFWFREMLRDSTRGDRPNSRTVEACLKASTSTGDDLSENDDSNSRLIESKILHGFSVKTGTGLCCYVQSTIHSIYSKYGSVHEANSAFHELSTKDIVSWTAILGVHARMGCVEECLQLFDEMTRLSDLVPDGVFLSCLISVFRSSSSKKKKKNFRAFHAVILRRKLGINNDDDEIIISNSLVKMYFELGLVGSAKHVFQTIQSRTRTNEESLNLMTVEFAKLGPTFRSECFEAFRKTSSEFGFQVNSKSLIATMSLCSRPIDLSIGKSIHGHVLKSENKNSATVSNSILSMYGRCGRLDSAKKLFDSMEKQDIITWNTMMSIYSNTSIHHEHTLRVFEELRRLPASPSNPNPNRTTYKIALSACSASADLTRGQLIHSYIISQSSSESSERLDQDVMIRTGLIDMYSKCGNLELAQKIFDSTHELSKDVVLWNTMISSYAAHGLVHEALRLFEKLENNHSSDQQRYDPPNEVTILAAMLACSHGGLVDQGKQLFAKMTDFYNLIPNCKHYACLVDMLARSGDLQEAEKLCQEMCVPDDGGTWGALLGACNVYGEIEIGERAGKRAIELDPCNHGYYVLLANLYGRARKWSDVAMVREMMQRKGMTKVIGFSSV